MILPIGGYSHEGEGVGHRDGRAYFVPGALKGETAEVLETGRKGGLTRCRLERLIQVSPARQSPACPFFYHCGGCALQHAAYPHQLEIKRDILSRALRVIGGVRDADIPPVIGMERVWGYRNKGVFAVGEASGRIQIGFYGKGSRSIQGQGCPGLMSEQANRILARLTQMLREDPSWRRSRGLRRVMLRESFSTGRIVLVFFVSGADAGLDTASRMSFADWTGWTHLMEAEPAVAGAGVAAVPSERGARAGRPEPDAARGEIWPVAGDLTLQERIGEHIFQISPEAFFQVNTEGARKLSVVAADLLELTGNETVLDLYCGTGVLGLSLSASAGRVIGVESAAEAVRDAKENARFNHIRNADFLTGRAEEWLPRLSGRSPGAGGETDAGAAIGAVILDPPRKGCAPGLLRSLIQSAPPRILYISCEPSTLARDLKILRQGGYVVQAIRSLDMFPQTFHMECVIMMTYDGQKTKG